MYNFSTQAMYIISVILLHLVVANLSIQSNYHKKNILVSIFNN